MTTGYYRFLCRRTLFGVGVLAIFILAGAIGTAEPPLGPVDVVASADGKRLFVACADAKQIAVVRTDIGKVTRKLAMPAEPTGIILGPKGTRLCVTCAAPKSTVVVLDATSGETITSIPTGHTACGPAISPDGKTLYVCNRFDNNLAVIDLATKKTALVPTTREPFAAVVTPGGKSVFVINHLPNDRADKYDVAAVVTVIDTATNKARTIRLPNGSTGVRDVCVSPDGKYVYATHVLSRYQMPTMQLERGWVNTNAMSIIDATEKKFYNTVLLDDVDRGAANPWGVACSADGKTVCVAHAGTHELSVIDAVAMHKKLAETPITVEEAQEKARGSNDPYDWFTREDVPNDLAFLRGLWRRAPLGAPAVNGPRGLVAIGAKAYVAGYFSDNMAVVDLIPRPADPQPKDADPDKPTLVHPVDTISLRPASKMSPDRRGEMLFNDATICFRHWQSCASCHPDARTDALNWDISSTDWAGKNCRSMILAHKTPPAFWSGIRHNAEAAVRQQIAHLLFTVQPEETAVAIDAYLKSLKPVPSPHLVDGKLSPAAQRGKKLFFDAKTGCAKCHPTPLFTDKQRHDVGSRGKHDWSEKFDTPTLIECWRTAPYMHDGQYTTVKELLTKGKHGNDAGQLEKLDERQIDDLVQYVLSL